MERAFQRQSSHGQWLRGQQNCLEVLPVQWECPDDPGEAGGSVWTAGQPAPIPQVSVLCPGDGFSENRPVPSGPLGSKCGCEVGEVMLVTPPGRKQPRAHTPGGFGEAYLVLLKGQADVV